MPRDPLKSLHKTITSLVGASCELSCACPQLLESLTENYPFPHAGILLLDDSGHRIVRSFFSSPTPHRLFQNQAIEESPWQEAALGRRAVQSHGHWVVPLIAAERLLGLLCVGLPEATQLTDEFREPLDIIGLTISQLLGSADRLVRTRQQDRLKDVLLLLALLLNRAQSLTALQRNAGRALIRFAGLDGVVLRPIHGGTLYGDTRVYTRSGWRVLQPLLQELEEPLTDLALEEGQPVFAGRCIHHPLTGAEIRVDVVSMILSTPDQVWGSLTLVAAAERQDEVLPLHESSREMLQGFATQLAHALERVMTRDQLSMVSHVSNRQVEEFSQLYRIARALHSTLHLDELTHLMLTAAAAPGGGGFERAMLFTVNERTATLQGMLSIDQLAATQILPDGQDEMIWDNLKLDPAIMAAQRQTDLNRQVVKQRLSLEAGDNALARAYHKRRVVLVPKPENESASGKLLAEELELGPYACVPLPGRDRPLGLMLVDNPVSGKTIPPERLHFLELFVSQAGAALENAQLVHRLEQTYEELREFQERLLQGEKLAVLGEMAAQVAHELRNPLVSIGGFAKRLERRDLGDPKANDYAAIVAREVRRMEEMLSNILAFSKKQLVCMEECDFNKIFVEAFDLEEENQQRVGIETVLEFATPLPILTGDCRQLRQVVLNLLINARQVMAEGGILTVRAGRCMLRGEEGVQFEVEDSGGGISPEVMRNIFNPFFSTRAKGTGLGLSISHRIIEQHHGEIEVLNGERGARFIVRLPVAPPKGACH